VIDDAMKITDKFRP